MEQKGKVDFINSEPITEKEILKIFTKYPIDFSRVKAFLLKESGIKEAFFQYTTQYINEFANIIGVELRPNIYMRLQEILLTCLVVGFLAKENLLDSKLDECLKEEKNESITTN